MSIEKFTGQFKNEARGCTVVINSTIQAITKFDVLGLYVYLCSKPETWAPNAKELMRHTGYSKEKIYRLIKDLMATGLMTVCEKREKGRFAHYEYTVHLHPVSPRPENQDTVDLSPALFDAVSPCPGFTDAVNQDAYKEKKDLEKKEKKIKDVSPDLLALQPYIDVWNEIAVKEGCPPMGTDKRQLLAIKRNIREVNKVWENELSPITFRIWLNNAVITKAFLICKYKSRMEVCVRPHHFLDIYNQVKEEQKA